MRRSASSIAVALIMPGGRPGKSSAPSSALQKTMGESQQRKKDIRLMIS